MSKKPSCNLCGASLVEEDCALICGYCARSREERLKDQAEQLAIARQMGYAEGKTALRAENEWLKADNLDLINKLEAEGFHNEAAAIRIAELTAALRPFAEYRFPEGEILRTSDRFHPMVYGAGELTVGDFHRAAAALKGEGE